MYRSPVLIKKKDAKNWIENKMKNYQDASVNQYHVAGYGKNVFTTTIAFDPKDTENLEEFLKRCGISFD